MNAVGNSGIIVLGIVPWPSVS